MPGTLYMHLTYVALQLIGKFNGNEGPEHFIYVLPYPPSLTPFSYCNTKLVVIVSAWRIMDRHHRQQCDAPRGLLAKFHLEDS